jgi:hypothetical protein
MAVNELLFPVPAHKIIVVSRPVSSKGSLRNKIFSCVFREAQTHTKHFATYFKRLLKGFMIQCLRTGKKDNVKLRYFKLNQKKRSSSH